MNDGINKRQFQRLQTTYIVRYRIHQATTGYDTGQTQNISKEGALLLTNKPFNQGDKLEMYIQFPFAREKNMVIAEVVFCKELTKESTYEAKGYETRLKFIEMNAEVKQKLGEMIERRKRMGQK